MACLKYPNLTNDRVDKKKFSSAKLMCINQHDLFLFSQPSFDKKNDTGEGVLILQNLYPILLYKPS